MRMVITNVKPRPIEDINFEGLTDIHFLVITDDKFETYWTALKEKCKMNFVKCDIHFIIPSVKSAQEINNFSIAFGVMMGEKNPRLHND